MKSVRVVFYLFFAASLTAAPALATTTHHAEGSANVASSHKTAAHGKSKAKTTKTSKSHKLHGQQAIDPERVTQIQQALIRERYMSGEANGQWDSGTQAAMQKFQSDQGWQTKLMPDSRALVKLGLGPDYSTAINAKDVASSPAPPPVNTIPANQASGFAAAAGVNQ
jgi:peptidoglycan hydrolase-like protein with peptidoglycan-binding domain